MDKKLLWLLNAYEKTPTRKVLTELAKNPDAIDESSTAKVSDYGDRIIASWEKAKRTGCAIVTFIDDEYPDCLRKIALPPPVLFVRGNVAALSHEVFVGMVGCRKCDTYGMRTATNLATEIAELGVGIVSGGAEGIDAAAHNGAIIGGAPTVAFFGSGLDVPYPECNIELFKKIVASGGAVVSEFMFGEPPNKRNFPHRNRLIAAMAQTVAVIQAGSRSGSLITADHAERMGKTVFAVPGNIDNALSVGTNRLICDGVLPLTSSMDIIDELMLKCPDFFSKERKSVITPSADEYNIKETDICENKNKDEHIPRNLSEAEGEVVALVQKGICTDSEIAENISFDPARLQAILGVLELKGVLARGFNKKYKVTSGGND